MIDVNKITSTLAKLPDQQLQQYAQMHKSDPYIMALAMSESNRRKELRAAGQSEQGMQEQPKVVDQMVAEMAPQQLPEDQGIGQLPAGEMNFAGGGIVAFADGGGVERYQSAGLVQDPRLASLLAARERYLRSNADTSAIDQAIAALRAKSAQGSAPTAASADIPMGGDFAEQMAQGITGPTFIAPTAAQQQAEYIRQQDKLMQGRAPRRRGDEFEGEEAGIAARATNAPPAAAPKADAARKDARPAPTAAAPTATADPFSMQSIREAQEEAMRDVNYQRGALRNEAVGLSNLYQQQAEDRLARRKQEIADEGDIFKGREARLNAREADIGKQRNENKGLAFLNAGLAIMSTPGGLATSLGKGAQVGTAQYASGLKDLRAAQQRLDDARDNIEELRLNRKDMNKKDIRALEKERDDNINKGKELLFGVAKDAYGADEKSATALFNAYTQGQTKVYEQGQETKRNERRVQGMIDARGGAAGTKEERLRLDTLKAMATNITNELKDPLLGLPRNAALKSAKQAELAQINAQLAQMSGLGTMLPPPSGSGGGQKEIDFNSIK